MIIEKFIAHSKNDHVIKQQGSASLLFGDFAVRDVHRTLSRCVGIKMKRVLIVCQGSLGNFLINHSDYLRNVNQAFARYKNKKNKFAEYLVFKQAKKDSATVYADFIRNRSSKNLLKFWRKGVKICGSVYAVSIFSEMVDEDFLSANYKKIKGDENKFPEFLAEATKIVFKSFDYRLDEGAAAGGDIRKIQYLFANYAAVPDLAEIKLRINDKLREFGGAAELRKSLQKRLLEIERNKKSIKKYRKSLSAGLRALFDFAQLAMLMRDERKIPLGQLLTIAFEIAKEYFIQAGLPIGDYGLSIYDDFAEKKYLQPGYAKELVKRKKGFIQSFSCEDGLQYETDQSGKKIKKVLDYVDKEDLNQKDLKGNVAYRGFVKGRARIILSSADFYKFRIGDILVTSMTRPEFVPLMKKAIGVITDEGGITCHAAIISRELRIPCVIGTKNATKFLKDGDLVDIDADNGIIKIEK
jgi:phosphohistidine swiveling domain-containing protein